VKAAVEMGGISLAHAGCSSWVDSGILLVRAAY
jgi:hypothetical protein